MECVTTKQWDGRQRKLLRKTCTSCGKDYYSPAHVNSLYCNRQCYFLSKKKENNSKCSLCNSEFYRAVSKKRSVNEFCSRKCKDYAQSLEAGLLTPSHYKTGIHSYRRKALLKYKNECCKCGYSSIIGMIDVDHIDSNRKNNKVDNLQLLCVWCHALKTRGFDDNGSISILQIESSGS